MHHGSPQRRDGRQVSGLTLITGLTLFAAVSAIIRLFWMKAFIQSLQVSWRTLSFQKCCHCPLWTTFNIPSPSISGERRLLTVFWTSRPASIPCPACRENSFRRPRKHYGEIVVLPSKSEKPYISGLESFFVHFTRHSYATVASSQFSFSFLSQRQSQLNWFIDGSKREHARVQPEAQTVCLEFGFSLPQRYSTYSSTESLYMSRKWVKPICESMACHHGPADVVLAGRHMGLTWASGVKQG